jgi:hypothetical protein
MDDSNKNQDQNSLKQPMGAFYIPFKEMKELSFLEDKAFDQEISKLSMNGQKIRASKISGADYFHYLLDVLKRITYSKLNKRECVKVLSDFLESDNIKEFLDEQLLDFSDRLDVMADVVEKLLIIYSFYLNSNQNCDPRAVKLDVINDVLEKISINDRNNRFGSKELREEFDRLGKIRDEIKNQHLSARFAKRAPYKIEAEGQNLTIDYMNCKIAPTLEEIKDENKRCGDLKKNVVKGKYVFGNQPNSEIQPLEDFYLNNMFYSLREVFLVFSFYFKKT